MKEGKRLEEVDIAKGVLILLVVLAHLPVPFKEEVYFFHMPAFFIISGIFLPAGKEIKKGFLKMKIKSFGSAYFVYLIIIGLGFMFLETGFELIGLGKLFWGGRTLYGPLGPFWFISCLLGSLVIYFYLEKIISNKIVKVSFIFFMYIFAHIESLYFQDIKGLFFIPLGLDICLIAVPFLYIGKFIKHWVIRLSEDYVFKWKIFTLSLFLIIFFFMLIYFNFIIYKMDMKYVHYQNFILDVFVPLVFTFFIITSSIFLKEIFLGPILGKVGKASLIIMYLHLPIIFVIKNHLTVLPLVIVSCLIPILLRELFIKNKHTARIFLGQW